ncbi:helix-turn-helix domain-containing protein [Spirillospora sp. CA-294931]|uniref:helix-turn-helix domain-containing protein n=1 Tax=Spirillospora sp. CA-294931 TaxID=3240042 RepID=UPI003D8F68B3
MSSDRRGPHPSSTLRVYFGWRLRSWRRQRGVTQAELADLLSFDHSYISKVESGDRLPSPRVAERCDAVLRTGGELAALLPLAEREAGPGEPIPGDSPCPDETIGPDDIPAMRRLLDAYRDAYRTLGGTPLIAPLEHHARTIVATLREAPDAARHDLLVLGTEYADVTGWARYDAGHNAMATAWFARGRDWAVAAGEETRAAVLQTYDAAVAWADGDPTATVVRAAAALAGPGPLTPGVRRCALVAEARGHALAGDAYRCDRALEAAEALRVEIAQEPDWFVNSGTRIEMALARATCERDLALRTGERGLPKASAGRLAEAIVEPTPRRDTAVSSVRLAGAYVAAGEPELAAAAVRRAAPVLGSVLPSHSARELSDVKRRLGAEWGDLRDVRCLLEEIRDLGDPAPA